MPEPLRFGIIGRAIFIAHTGKTSPRRMRACFPASFTVPVGKTPSPLAGTGDADVFLWLRHRKRLMLYSLKLQRNNQ